MKSSSYFDPQALELYAEMMAEKKGVDFSEGETYDFTRCIRPDGSSYGTGGKCRQGSESGPAERKQADAARKQARLDAKAAQREVAELKKKRDEAAAGPDKKAAAEARRKHIEAKNRMKELMRKHEDAREAAGDLRRFGKEQHRYKATREELQAALDSGKLSARTAEKVKYALAWKRD